MWVDREWEGLPLVGIGVWRVLRSSVGVEKGCSGWCPGGLLVSVGGPFWRGCRGGARWEVGGMGVSQGDRLKDLK